MRRFRRDRSLMQKVPLTETLTMLRRYVIQETLGPLRHIGRKLGFGLLGALLSGVGAVLVLLGFLRLLEGETGQVFSGNWSFVPYVFTAILAGLMIFACVLSFTRRGRSS